MITENQDSFLCFYNFGLPRAVIGLISINNREVIFQPVRPLQTTSCFPALRANDKQHLFVRQPKSQPQEEKKTKNGGDFSLFFSLETANSPCLSHSLSWIKAKQRRERGMWKFSAGKMLPWSHPPVTPEPLPFPSSPLFPSSSLHTLSSPSSSSSSPPSQNARGTVQSRYSYYSLSPSLTKTPHYSDTYTLGHTRLYPRLPESPTQPGADWLACTYTLMDALTKVHIQKYTRAHFLESVHAPKPNTNL